MRFPCTRTFYVNKISSRANRVYFFKALCTGIHKEVKYKYSLHRQLIIKKGVEKRPVLYWTENHSTWVL